jgi:zinc D-Ala-D-Ala dipeptidase
MLTKRFLCLSSIALGIVLIPSTPALLQSVNSSSVTQTDKNSVTKDNPALLPPVTTGKPPAPASSTSTTDVKNPVQVISTPDIKLPDSTSSTKTTDLKNPVQVISTPDVKPPAPASSTSKKDVKNPVQVISTPDIKLPDSTSSTKTTDVKNPAQIISVPDIKLPDSASSTKTTYLKNPAQEISVPEIKSSVSTPIPSAVDAKKSPEITSEAKVKPSAPTKNNNDLVDLEKIAPHIRKDIRYATANNFMNRKLYPVSRCLLHAKVAEQLKQVQIELEKDNLGLKVFDCYRPLSIQKQMWKILPDNNYVANPAQGSRHNRASAVDLTLVDFSTGKDKEMPSKYDEFSKKAHMDYEAASIESKKNRKRLRIVMEKHGFKSIPTEWWHYDSSEWKQYPLLDISWN